MKLAIQMVLIGGVIWAAVPVVVAQDGNAVPYIESVTWRITRNDDGFTYAFFTDGYVYQFSEPFDPVMDLARELDVIFATLTIVDPDWEPEDGDEDQQDEGEPIYYRFRALWMFYGSYYTPEPPPISQSDRSFQPREGDGISPGPGETTLELRLRIDLPEFEGRNQARLRGLIDWDVSWLFEFCVSNEQQPEDEQFTCTGELVYAIENPVLAGLTLPNPPPFADAGPDQTVEVDTTALLDGSRTFDGYNIGFDTASEDVFDKDTLTFTWEWISGPARVEPVQGDPSDPVATVDLEVLGDYVYRVTVDDNVNSLPSTDSVTITVVEDIPGNHTPTADVSVPSGTIRVGDTITVDGSGSSDPDGDELRYYWRQTDELGGQLPADELNRVFQPISGTHEAVSTWQAVHAGTFYVRLLVSDGQLTDVSEILSLEVIEASTAGTTVRNDEPATPAAEEDAGQVTPTPMLCGAGAVSLAFVPFLLWPLRGRFRG